MRVGAGSTASTAFDRNSGASATAAEAIELSVVLPCLNEVETVGVCVRKALATLRESGISGEVIVADNGSVGWLPRDR